METKHIIGITSITVVIVGIWLFLTYRNENVKQEQYYQQAISKQEVRHEKTIQALDYERERNNEYQRKENIRYDITQLEKQISNTFREYEKTNDLYKFYSDKYRETNNKVTLRFKKQKEESSVYYDLANEMHNKANQLKYNHDDLVFQLEQLKKQL